MSQKVDTAISEGYSLLDNLQNHDELKVIAPTVGVDAALISHGDALYKRTQKASEEQQRLHAEYLTAGRNLKAHRTATKRAYSKHVQMVRLNISDEVILNLLQAEGKREKANADSQDEMRQFYGVALEHPEVNAALLEGGFTQAALEKGRSDVLGIDTRVSARVSVNERRKAATKHVLREARLLRRWTTATRTLMEPAVEDKPHLKEALGIPEPEEKDKAKQKAAKKQQGDE